jgi:hypothetical protein
MLDRRSALRHVVAMDSLIHYRAPTVRALGALARGGGSPSSPSPRRRALALMHAVGRLFPAR